MLFGFSPEISFVEAAGGVVSDDVVWLPGGHHGRRPGYVAAMKRDAAEVRHGVIALRLSFSGLISIRRAAFLDFTV
ncbi:hypothetical protein [Bradyrhizobium sp.]|uniref:hypothetical protein n=1 Tax=Bradyrhizobium sp. TaxID=376 RepID=UPI003C709805